MSDQYQATATNTVPVNSLPPILRRFALWTMLLGILDVGAKYVCRHVLHLPEAYDNLVFPQSLHRVDFVCFFLRFRDFHHSTFFATDYAHGLMFMYPAPAALVYQFFYILPRPMGWYLLACFAGILTAALQFSGALKKRGISQSSAYLFTAVCVIFSFPLFFNLWLGNMEIFVAFLIWPGLYCVITGRYWLAGFLIGLAGAIKFYPLVFLALLFSKKRYREIAFSLVLYGVVTLFAMWLVSGSIATSQHGIQVGLEAVRNGYTLPFNTLDSGVDHSLFALIKSSIIALGITYPSLATIALISKFYVIVMAIIGLSLYFLRIRYLPLLNQVLCIGTIAVTLTPASRDYTLLHLYVPWAMLVFLAVEAYRTGQKIPGMKAAFICFVLVMSPLNEFILHSNVIAGQIKALVLVALLVIGLRYPFVAEEQPSVYAPA